jgi:hypothetical protein
MKQHEFHKDELVTVWRRHTIAVNAESQEEAENLIREKGITNTLSDEFDYGGGIVEFLGTCNLPDTFEGVTVEENAGIPTIVIQTIDQRSIADNCENRHYLAETGQSNSLSKSSQPPANKPSNSSMSFG